MGNSLLDIIVFGRIAGQSAAEKYPSVSVGKLALTHVENYENALKDAEVETQTISPMLLPSYARRQEYERRRL
ncbi:MAG: succinate dehydrogenase/fumarate reductase flavoprotein subunit, partial [Clostridiales bacterium]|nr:succinate dehydrogenase/fumarate reductase flavoprotein subunit [Clostridiales bacterium]